MSVAHPTKIGTPAAFEKENADKKKVKTEIVSGNFVKTTTPESANKDAIITTPILKDVPTCELIDITPHRGFHLAEITPACVCIYGWQTKPDIFELRETLKTLGDILKIKVVPTRENNAFKNHYVYVTFTHGSFNEQTKEKITAICKEKFQKENEELKTINRYSSISQVFFGSVHESVTEKDILENVSLGENLIHIEIKKRPKVNNSGTNYGFCSFDGNIETVQHLLNQRYFFVKGHRMEFKKKSRKERVSKIGKFHEKLHLSPHDFTSARKERFSPRTFSDESPRFREPRHEMRRPRFSPGYHPSISRSPFYSPWHSRSAHYRSKWSQSPKEDYDPRDRSSRYESVLYAPRYSEYREHYRRRRSSFYETDPVREHESPEEYHF